MLKFFVNDLRRNLTKLFCLTIGLAIGLLLVAKAYIEQSYDSFIPENGNVYIITESIITHGEFMEYLQTPGAIAPGLKRYAPPVESATRFTQITGELTVKTPDGQLFDADALILADTCAFDVLRQPVISGNPKEALAVENHCMIPRSLAEKIGGDVIGTTLSSPELNDSYSVMIDGIYEDFPVNSTFTNAIYLSMPSIGNFMGDGTENWVGNDRYKSYVRLVDGATADDVRPYIDRMIRKELPPRGRRGVPYEFRADAADRRLYRAGKCQDNDMGAQHSGIHNPRQCVAQLSPYRDRPVRPTQPRDGRAQMLRHG